MENENSNTPKDDVKILHCLKCKTKQPVEQVQHLKAKNNRNFIKAVCTVCNGKVCSFLSK